MTRKLFSLYVCINFFYKNDYVSKISSKLQKLTLSIYLHILRPNLSFWKNALTTPMP